MTQTDLGEVSAFEASPVIHTTIAGEAVADLFTPAQPVMRRAAHLSPCGDYRWTLRRSWGEGARVCWIMLNPSTADHEKDDPTIRRCIHFTNAWGYRNLVVVNLYPLRSPRPAECRKWADWENNGPDWYGRDRQHDNVNVVAKAAKASALVVAAWGAIAWDDIWVEHVAEEVMCGVEPWPAIHCLGMTASGAPKHPMARGVHRVPDDQLPVLWRDASA